MTLFDLPKLRENLFSVKNWPKDEWLELLGIQYTENNDHETIVEVSCLIPQTLSWFQGHYPDQPVLPGVVQTYWVTELSQILFPTGEFKGINALKFINMIMPETSLNLILKFTHETNSVAFSYVSDDDEIKFSSGKIFFAHNE